MRPTPSYDARLHVQKAVYGGDGLARTAGGEVVLIPFVLPGEILEGAGDTGSAGDLEIKEPSPDRVTPGCVHFGVCGGCQYQMAAYPAQLRMKAAILRETMDRAGLRDVPEASVSASPEPWGYRNRIRLRVRTTAGSIRLGYSLRGSQEFLPITMCPIATPILWETAKALEGAAARAEPASWLTCSAEAEIACNGDGQAVQVHLLCPPGPVPHGIGSFDRLAAALLAAGVPLKSLGASRLHVPSGRPLELLASWGAEGMPYRVGEESFWLKRGSFFQINRFLISRMVELVAGERSGPLAWDLYAGVGLFARALTEKFEAVTAVEANPVALAELQRGLRRPQDAAVSETTLTFLRRAVLQRERPQLIVLDPPRAGAGAEVCSLLLRLAPAEVVYVSCDPVTLARDAAVLTAEGHYRVAEVHLLDLFPQTYHLETVMVLRRQM